MKATRLGRIERQIFREITLIIREELKDPRIGFVTITRIELSADLHSAKVYVSILGAPQEQEETLKVLMGAAGFIRSKLGERMRLRLLPEIIFKKDDSMEHADRVFRILKDLNDAEPRKNKTDA